MKFKLILGVFISILLSMMNTYSRALHHISMKDVKQKHQENKIKKKIVEEIRRNYLKELSLINSPEFSNWREEISEGMTTSDVFTTTYPATGDVDLSYPEWNISDPTGTDLSGGTVTITATGESITDGFIGSFDSSLYTTLVFDLTVNGDSALGVFSETGGILIFAQSSGTYSINVEQSPSLQLLFGIPSNIPGSVSISNLRFQRRTPLNVFVPLDSPEAVSFMRTGNGDLSPEERKQKLKEMLEASDDYVMNIFGSDFPGTGTTPPGEVGDTPGVEIAGTANFPPVAPGYGFRGRYDQFGREIDPKTGNPVQSPMPPAKKLKQADTGTQDTQIAQNWTDDPSTWPSIKNPVKSVPAIIDPKTGWPSVPNVPPSYKGKPGGTKLKLAHHQPEGQVILEKKKLKSPEEILKKNRNGA